MRRSRGFIRDIEWVVLDMLPDPGPFTGPGGRAALLGHVARDLRRVPGRDRGGARPRRRTSMVITRVARDRGRDSGAAGGHARLPAGLDVARRPDRANGDVPGADTPATRSERTGGDTVAPQRSQAAGLPPDTRAVGPSLSALDVAAGAGGLDHALDPDLVGGLAQAEAALLGARASTSRNARRMMLPSLSLISRSSQRKCCMFCTHSK